MSEDVGVKAPVTRLRRRLSVESEEVKSPAGTTTPNKKKGGRLATKPQLDLIEEIDADQVPKRSTRKTAAKDIIEPVEEKPMTPSRRSARIRSNTSILSETSQALDSPRAKRAAARRTSQAGSDNDAPLTPARQTRRTRKDSRSSIDNQVNKANNKTSAATDVIVEEKESNDNDVSNSKEKSVSKSPKLRGKKGKTISTSKSHSDTENDLDIKKHEDFNTSTNKENQDSHEQSSESKSKTSSVDNSEKKDIVKDSDSKVDTSEILTENLDAKPKINNSILHKSTTAIEDSKKFKSKRHRTKSVSAITSVNSNDFSFFSDTEISKKNRKKKSLTPHSNDICLSYSQISKHKNDKSLTPVHITNKDDTVQNTVVSSKRTDDDKESKLKNTPKSSPISEKSITINKEFINNSVPKAGWKKNIINQIETENITDSKDNNDYISPIKCFENAPSKDIQSVVFIENDSDSDVCNNDNVRPAPHLDNEDQCVPVVKHDNQNNSNEQIPHDNSYEPMDIDESIQNTSTNTSMKNTPKTPNQLETKKKSLESMNLSNDCNNLSSNKSKRKSSLYSFETHNEKSSYESKSTLLLSHIKDTSCNNIDEKSPKVNKNDQLSKSINLPDKIKNKEAEKRKLSLDYSTSTPLQQKSTKNLNVPIDTSLISPKSGNKAKTRSHNTEKSKDSFDNSKEQNNQIGDDSDQSKESDTEVTKTQNEIIDDEAEEASDDYQSGDSQDESEKQYEEENEIVEKGETLDTDEEFSDDTDYEKDSFVVSSNEEDNELLSGSGDDISMSDNELSMSAKSKKKYNEKKIKEQKKASREMFEARHKLDNSDKKVLSSKSKKNNRRRLDSSSSDSDEEITVQPKKNNRQRIDSSQDLSQVKSDDNETITNKKKQNRLSESVCSYNILDEQEITICNENEIEDKDPISVVIKHEPKTPQKNENLIALVVNENINEINLEQNTSIMNPTETSDTLQATMFEEDEYTSSSEDNNEIMKNYNSILENLSTNPEGIKMHDISLNVNKKQKKNKEPIVDQLNLTQTKSKKNKKKPIKIDVGLPSEIEFKKSEKDNKVLIEKDDDDASDSIDMRLLFTEDSNDSESATTDKMKEINVAIVSENKDYIPLKKTEAKTNLLEDMDTAIKISNSSHLNESKKKNKKRISSQNIPEAKLPSSEMDHTEGSFFIDTTGTRFDMDETISPTLSNKKKKNRNSECDTNVEVKELLVYDDETGVKKTPKKTHNTENQIDTEVIIEEAADVSSITTPGSGKKKKKGKKSLNITEVEEIPTPNEIGQDIPTESAKTPLSGKKKNKSMVSLDEDENIYNIQEEMQQEKSFEIKASSDKKKAKKSLTNIQNESQIDEMQQEKSFEIKASSDKKKAKKSLTNIQNESQIDGMQQEKSFEIKASSDKKKAKKSLTNIPNESQIDEIQQEKSFEIKANSDKKKVKKSLTNIPNESQIDELQQEKSFEIKGSSDKKKARNSFTNIQNESQIDETCDMPPEVIHTSDKKRKSRHSNIDIIPLELNKSDDEESPLEISYRSEKKDKSGLESQLTENQVDTETSLNTSKNSGKKRKRKHSATTDEKIPLENVKENYKDEQLHESLPGNQKKRRKLNNTEEQSTQDKEYTKNSKRLPSVETSGLTKLMKDNHGSKQENIPIIHKEDTEKLNNNKKRKERDDDDTTNAPKMIKHNSLNKVTRLPSYILNQLGDKPNKSVLEEKRAKLIATSNFTVENIKVRRNKPSNYLEESVYLNDDNIVEKQKKYSIKKPKVLPFIPTASTSGSGFTTNFRINLLSRETQFVAQATDVINFKKDFLQQQKIKKFHTFEKYKNQRNVKLSKF